MGETRKCSAYFGRKPIIRFHVQLYSLTFRNRKVTKDFRGSDAAAKAWLYFSTHQTIVDKAFPHLRSLLSSLADAPHCSIMGFVLNQTISAQVLFFYIVMQSTGQSFLPSSLTRDDFYKCYFYV